MTRVQATVPLLTGLLYVCSAAQPVPGELGQIKEMVNKVDASLNTLNKSHATLETGTDRGGKLTIYRRDSDVVRIDAIIGGSNSDLQEVFYYSGEHLVFVRTKVVTYPYSSSTSGFDFANPHVKAAADYHVRGRKLIPVDPATVGPSVASTLLQEAELFMTAIRRGNHIVDIEKLLK